LNVIDLIGGGIERYSYAQKQAYAINPPKADAAVDSELSLITLALKGKKYKLAHFLPNPMNWRLQQQMRIRGAKLPDVMMTARIDGPTAGDAMRIIKASIETEKKGLSGKFYIDAGGKYPRYDDNLKKLDSFLRANTKMPAVFDDNKSLFKPGSCPHAALYVGWYSLKRYVPAFMWVPGSVGWHVASFEAMHLRDPNSNEWCVKMIQNGVAATIGAVNEPTLAAFPLPQDFFPLLMTGKYTLAECYWRTNPMVSWRMTLIGDPLYNPFAANPQLNADKLPRDLAP
ncbi:MAG: TIGR03790 family protein, partial [Phycisphaerae bacterium]|nr:TIGR03790 family protein [Phycisphaerae bacterium]